jgi:hypothetical protein
MAIFTTAKNLYKWAIGDTKKESMEGWRDNAQKIDDAFSSIETDLSWEDINVKTKKFGAKGNSTTSDSLAFQTAMNIAKTAGVGVRIKIPTGTYRMTSELKVYPNTKFICGPNVKIVRDHPLYLMVNGFRTTEATPTTAGGYNGVGNVHIDGGIWDGNGVVQTAKASIFHFGHGDGFTIENATFKDASNSHHIEFNACQNVRVKDCKYLGWVGTIDDYNEAIQLDLAKPGNTTIGLEDNTVCKNVWIEDSYFGKSTTVGANKLGRAVGSHSATINRWHENINVLNNVIEDTLTWGVRAYSWKNFRIDGNKLNNCAQGINVRTNITSDSKDTINDVGTQTSASQICEDFSVSGNQFSGGGTVGRFIEIYGEATGKPTNGEVNFNIIKGKGTAVFHGIYLVYADDITIYGNQIKGLAGGTTINGIDIANSVNCDISVNKITDVAGDGIHSTPNCHDLTVNHNTVKRVGKNSIYIADTTNGVVIHGNILTGCNGSVGGATVNFIRITGTVKRISIVGNVCSNVAGTHVATVAMEITSTCTEVTRGLNVFKGFTVTDASTGGLATGADLI